MNDATPDHQDEIALIDLVVALAEAWIPLVVAPILAGVIAYLIYPMLAPRTNESRAVLHLSVADVDLLKSARVLDGPVNDSPIITENGNSLPLARRALLRSMAITKLPTPDYYEVTITHQSAATAQSLLSNILKELTVHSKPTGTQRSRVEERLSSRREELANLNASLERLNKIQDNLAVAKAVASTSGDTVGSIATLIGQIQNARVEILNLTQSLLGLTDAAIIQPPVITASDAGGRRLIVVIAAAGAVGLLMLIVIFLRAVINRGAGSADHAAKLARIRRAFWLKANTRSHAKS